MPPTLTPEIATKLLAEILPDRGTVSAVSRFAEGSVTGAYRVEFSRDDVEPIVVKVYQPESVWFAAEEAKAFKLMHDRGLSPIAEILGFRKNVDELDGAACVVTSFLRGIPLSAVTEELSPDEEREIWRQLGAILKRFHEIPMPSYGYIIGDVVNPRPDNRSHMQRSFDNTLRDFRKAGGDREIADAAEARAAAQVSAFDECAGPVLCHGDFHTGNVVAERASDGRYVVTGVLDPQNMHSGDPLVDIVRTDAFSICDDATRRAGLLEGYGMPGDQWPAEWLERMELYRILLALELFAWFTSVSVVEPLPGLDRELRALLGIAPAHEA